MASNSVTVKLGLTGTDKVLKGLKTVSSAVSSIAKMSVGLAGLGSVVSLGGITVGLKNAAALGSRLSDVAAQTNMTAGEVMVMQQAFKDAGISTEAVQTSMAQLNKSIAQARSGSKEYVEALKKIGLKYEDLYKMASAERFRAVAAGFNNLTSSVERSEVAMKIFGRSGNQLLSLFSDPQGFQKAEQVLGSMPDVMTRSAVSFDKISDAWNNVGIKSQQFYAGMLEPLEPTVNKVLTKFNSMDFTPLGQKVGIALNVGIQMAKEGKTLEFLEDVVDLTYTYSMSKLSSFSGSLKEKITDNLKNGLEYALVKSALKFGEVMLNVMKGIGDYTGAALIYSTKGYLNLINPFYKFDNTWEKALQEIRNARDEFKDADIIQLGIGKIKEYEEYVDKVHASDINIDKELWDKRANELKTKISEGYQTILQKAPETVSLPEKPLEVEVKADNTEYLEKEKKLIEQLADLKVGYSETEIAMLDVTNAKTKIGLDYTKDHVKQYNIKKELAKQEKELLLNQLEILVAQRENTKKQIKLRKDELENNDDLDKEKREKLKKEVESLQDQERTLNKQIKEKDNAAGLVELSLGANPNGIFDQIQSATAELYNSIGTLAENIGKGYKSIVSGMRSSLSDFFYDTASHTKGLKDAWNGAWVAMGKTTLRAISDAVSAYVASKTVMIGMEYATSATMLAINAATNKGILAQDTAAAAADMSIWTPAAIVKSIATMGAAVLVGFAAMAAIMAINGFETGGRVGGGEKFIRVNERGSEYVVSAKSPASNDKWLDFANRGYEIDDMIDNMRNSQPTSGNFVRSSESAPSQTPQTVRHVTVRTPADLRREWKQGGLVEFIRENDRRGRSQ